MSSGPPTARPDVARLVELGSTQYYLLHRALPGHPEGRLHRNMMNTFGATGATVYAAIARAERAAQAAELLVSRGLEGRLSATEIMRPDRGCLNWQYTFRVSWADASGHIGYRAIHITRTRSLTLGEAIAAAQANILEYQTQMGSRDAGGYPMEGDLDFGAGSTDLLAVERVCS